MSGRYALIKDFSRNEDGNTYVNVEASYGNKPLCVELGFKCAEINSKGEGLRYTYDSQKIERGNLRDTRTELTNLIQTTPELAEWTVHVDGDKLKFNRLSQAESVELLMAALNQPPWTQYQDNARKTLAKFTDDLTKAQQSHRDCVTSQSELSEAVEGAKERLKEAKAEYKEALELNDDRIEKAKEKMESLEKQAAEIEAAKKDIKKKLKKIEEDKAEAYAKLEIERKSAQSSRSNASRARDITFEQRSNAAAARKVVKSEYDVLTSEPDTCPTCGSPWNKQHGDIEIKACKKRLDEASSVLEKADQKLTEAEELLENENDKYSAVQEKIDNLQVDKEIRALSVKYENLDSDLADINERISSKKIEIESLKQGPDRSGIIAAETRLKEREEAHGRAKSRLKELATEVTEAETTVAVGRYWLEAFSPVGIPNMILTESLTAMNEISHRISAQITGGTISVQYATSKELVSGKSKAALTTTVHNRFGSSKAEGSSKGESGLTNLIISETLSEVGNVAGRIGYRWYDEVINSQDQTVRTSMLDYMKAMAHSRKILVFVVDHHSEIENFADYTLIAEKFAEGTKFRWS